MRDVLTGGLHAVVAGGAIAGDATVIKGGRDPGGRCMTIVTRVGTVDVLDVLAGCDVTIVTRSTGGDHLGVIDTVSRRPQRRAVACLASICRADVLNTFAGGLHTVVARGAVAGDVTVIKGCGDPAGSGVAIVATVTAAYVGWRLSGNGGAVMTGSAGPGE